MKKVLTLLSASALGFTGIFTLGATTSSSYATEAEQPKQEKQYTFKFATDDVVQAMAPFLKTAENDIYANAYDYAAHIIRTPHVFNYVTNKIFEHGLFAQGTSDKVLNDLKQESNFDKITADFNALGVGMTDQQRKRFILNYIITLRAQWKVEVAREAYYRAYVNQNNGKAPRPSDVIGLIGDDFNITNLQALSKIGNQQLRESLLQEYQAISQAQKISNHETDLDFIRGAKNIDGQGFALDMQTSPYRNNDGTLYPGKGQITRQDSADSGVLVADFSDFVDDEEDENNDAPSSQGQSTQKENVVKNDSDLFDDESSVSVTDSEEDESKKSDESISSDEDGNDDFNFFEESASEDETQGVINPKNKLQPNEFNSKGEWDPFGIDNEPSAQNQAPAASSPSAAATAIPADQADWGAELFGYGDGSEPANAPATEKTLPTNSADEFSKQEFNDLLSRAGVSYNDLLIWHKEILRSTVRRGSNQGTWNSVTSRHGLDKMRENFSAQNIIARATFEALNNEGQYSQSLQEAINNLTSPNDQQFLNAYGQALWQKAQEKRGLNKGPQEKSAASERGGDAFDGIDLGEGQDWGDIEDFDSLAQEESARKEQERYDSLAEARERDTEAESTAKEEDEVEAAPQRPARKALEAETFTNIDQLDRYQILRNTFPEVDDTKLESIARRENSVFSGYIMTELSNGQENLRFDDPRFANSVEAFAKELGLSPEELRAKESDLDAAIKAQAEEEHNVARREAAKKEQSSDPFADLFDESGKPQGGSVPQPPSVTEKQVKEANQTLWDGAIAGNYYDVARALQLEASVNALDPVSFETALILASQADENEEQLRVVDRLLEAGADVNIANRNGENALHAAAQAGNAGTVRKLLAAGANPLAVTNEGQTPLDIAKEENHEEIVALLEALQSGDIASRQPILPAQQDKPQRPAMSQMKDEDELKAAAATDTSDPFADLFDESGKPQGGSVPQPPSVTEKQVKEANQTLWDGAIAGNYYDVARALQLEASVNALDPVSFETALILASQADENEEQLRVVDRLLEAGADVNIANRNGENALHAAAQAGNAGTVRKLLAAGANPLAVTNEGQTPLDIAKEENHEEIVALLEALQSGDIASRQPILPAQQDKPQRPAMSQMKDEDELEAAAATTVADGADDEDDFFGEIDLGEGQNWGDIDDFAPASVDPDVASEGVSPDVIGGGSDGDEEPPVARNLTPEFNDAADDGQGEREEPYSIPPGEPGGSAGAPVGGSAVADDEDEGDDNSSDGSSSDGEGDDRSEADFIPDESPFQREFNELVRLQSAIAKWDANDKGADYYNLMKELHAKAVEVRHLYADEVLYPIAIKLEQLERNKTIEKEKVREALNFIRTK